MKKITIGFLILVILTSSFYIMLPEKVRIDVEKTRTKYQVYENGWTLAATEYVNLFDGSKKMRASERTLSQSTDSKGIIKIERIANYKDDITTVDIYKFDSKIDDVKLTPISHATICINCIGKILQFEYRDILYTGETQDISSPFSFGHKMTLEWASGSYRSKVYQQITNDKIIIRYRPKYDNEIFFTRLFDPPAQGAANINISIIYPLNDTVYFANLLDLNWSINITTNASVYSLDGGANSTAVFFGNVPTNVSLGNLQEGSHTVVIYANDSSGNMGQSDLLTFNITHPLNTTLNSNLTGLAYNVNWSIVNSQLNFSDTATSAGNFTWNMTEINLTHYPDVSYTYNIKNNRSVKINVTLKINRIEDWFRWWCDSTVQTATEVIGSVNEWCYQESANVSTTCGGFGTGAYNWSGNWGNIQRFFDELWSADSGSTVFMSSNGDAFVYFNYSKPDNALNTSLWIIEGAPWTEETNISLPEACFNQDPIQIRLWDKLVVPTIFMNNWSCWNGTAYQIFNSSNEVGTLTYYEEAMWWDISTNLTRQNITDTSKTLFELDIGESKFLNCTLDLINISQTYVNWSITIDKANWTFTAIFNQTGGSS